LSVYKTLFNMRSRRLGPIELLLLLCYHRPTRVSLLYATLVGVATLQNWSHVATHLVVVVVVVVVAAVVQVVGATSSKKPQASSFQIGSGWDLAGVFVN